MGRRCLLVSFHLALGASFTSQRLAKSLFSVGISNHIYINYGMQLLIHASTAVTQMLPRYQIILNY